MSYPHVYIKLAGDNRYHQAKIVGHNNTTAIVQNVNNGDDLKPYKVCVDSAIGFSVQAECSTWNEALKEAGKCLLFTGDVTTKPIHDYNSHSGKCTCGECKDRG